MRLNTMLVHVSCGSVAPQVLPARKPAIQRRPCRAVGEVMVSWLSDTGAANRGGGARTRRSRVTHEAQFLAHRAGSKICPVLSVQFVGDVLEMELDGVLGDAEFGPDVAVAQAGGDELEDLQFAVGQAPGCLWMATRRSQEFIDDSGGSGWCDGRFTTGHAFDP